jgi:hypothetical protein
MAVSIGNFSLEKVNAMKESNAPQGQDNPANDANDSKDGGALRNVSPPVTKDPPSPPKTANSNHDSNPPPWWKRLNWNLIIEILVLIVGLRVAWIYKGQLDQMIEANRLTGNALELSRKMFAASQAAGLECRPEFTANTDRPWVLPRITVVCPNKGKSNASNVVGEIRFTRMGPDGKVVQDETKSINQSVVFEGDGLNPELFIITKKFDFEKYSRQRIKVEGSLSYDNSISRVRQKFCQELIFTPVTRSYGWTTCENAEAVRKNPAY